MTTPAFTPSATPRWPQSQLFPSAEEQAAAEGRCATVFIEHARALRIEADLRPHLRALYVPLAGWLIRRRRAGPLVVGLCGAQGSGKSTVTALLQTVLTAGFGRRVAAFSIDDIYKTREARQTLACTVHPLFATRGVPFTHDVALGIETLERLKSLGEGEACAVPAFDKALDTRHPRTEWPVVTGPLDLIVLEGWCVGARPQPEAELATPVNPLERDEDPDGTWRRRSNQALAGCYQQLFGQLEVLLMLEVAGMERVFEWRRLQEHKLAARARESGADLRRLSIMSDAEVDRFVMHYERLTRHILAEMPARADIVLAVDDDHHPGAVRINRPV